MNFLFVGTAIVWLAILGYMISLSTRQNKLTRQLADLELRTKRNDQAEDRFVTIR
jgi:CcmD family protein